jgi:glycine reductase
VALVTDGGLVPKGNPDHIPRGFARVWGAYSITGKDALAADEYEVSHGGYDNRQVQSDPHRLVPVDVMRQMERDGVVGRLHPEFLSTTGNVNPLENSRRIGREMAERLKEAGVDSVILTST